MAAAYNWIVFGERITLKMCVGMVIVIVSVMWLSLISGKTDTTSIASNDIVSAQTSGDIYTLQLKTISVGMVLSFVSSLRPI